MTDVPADSGRPAWPTGPSGPRNGMGTTALVLGIIGFFLAFVVIGGILGIAAVVLGIVALGRVRRGEANNRGVAIGGIVAGALAIVLAGVIIAAGAAFWSENKDEINDLGDCLDRARSQEAEDRCEDQFREQLEN